MRERVETGLASGPGVPTVVGGACSTRCLEEGDRLLIGGSRAGPGLSSTWKELGVGGRKGRQPWRSLW